MNPKKARLSRVKTAASFTITRFPWMSNDQFIEILAKSLRNNGVLDRSVLARLTSLALGLKTNDSVTLTYVVQLDDSNILHIPSRIETIEQGNKTEVPYPASLLVCFMTPVAKQKERIGDLQEMLNNLWIPKFGPRIGRAMCVWHSLWSVGGIIRFGLIAAVVDKIRRWLDW